MRRSAVHAPTLLAIVTALAVILASCSSGPPSQSSGPSSASVESSGAATSAAPAPAHATLKVGVSQQAFSFTPLFVGDKKQFWQDENLDVEFVFFNSGTENQQALLGDAIDIGAGGYTEPITLTSQGTPTVIFGTIQGALPFRLMVKPEITDIQQLDGKILGRSRPGSLTDQLIHIALTQKAFDPKKATFQAVGGPPEALAALQSGAIAGTLLPTPSYQIAQRAGYNTLLNLSEQLAGFPYELLYAKKETIESDPDVFVRFLKGYIKAATYATDPANENEVLDILVDATGQKLSDLKLAYDDSIKDFPADAHLDKNGIKLALDGTKQFGDVSGIDKVTVDDLYYPDVQAKASAG
jgi:ABC-type nitrate/sulfonate/bicarbonate transport system substrate-binding protein